MYEAFCIQGYLSPSENQSKTYRLVRRGSIVLL